MPLEDAPYTWRATGDGRVMVSWQGRQVRILTGEHARRLLDQLKSASPRQQQFLLAKATGNFKRGNERR